MKVLRTIFDEVLGLFVDDWAFAGLVLLWVGMFTLPVRSVIGAWAGPALFSGFAVLTLVFVARKARH